MRELGIAPGPRPGADPRRAHRPGDRRSAPQRPARVSCRSPGTSRRAADDRAAAGRRAVAGRRARSRRPNGCIARCWTPIRGTRSRRSAWRGSRRTAAIRPANYRWARLAQTIDPGQPDREPDGGTLRGDPARARRGGPRAICRPSGRPRAARRSRRRSMRAGPRSLVRPHRRRRGRSPRPSLLGRLLRRDR